MRRWERWWLRLEAFQNVHCFKKAAFLCVCVWTLFKEQLSKMTEFCKCQECSLNSVNWALISNEFMKVRRCVFINDDYMITRYNFRMFYVKCFVIIFKNNKNHRKKQKLQTSSHKYYEIIYKVRGGLITHINRKLFRLILERDYLIHWRI